MLARIARLSARLAGPPKAPLKPARRFLAGSRQDSPEQSRSYDGSVDIDSPLTASPRYADVFASFEDDTDVMVKACARSFVDDIALHIVDWPEEPMDVFDERLDESNPENNMALSPNKRNVRAFLRRVMRCADFELSVLVCAAALFKRAVRVLKVTEYSWRLLLFTTICIAQKLVDDYSIAKASQLEIVFTHATDMRLPGSGESSARLKRLEARFLTALEFRVCVDEEWEITLHALKALAVMERY